MTAHAWRLPLSLDPLIAEAKRRARQRRLLVAVVVFLVAAAGAGAVTTLFGSSDVRSLQAALAPSVFAAPNNNLVGGVRGKFSIVLGLTNGAHEPVSLEQVRAVLTARSSLRQFATTFRLYNRPVCAVVPPPGAVPGPCFPFAAFTLPPNGARQPAPLPVAPGHEALAQLSFRFATCTSRALLESVSIQKLTVVYGLPNGTRIYQHPRLPLARPGSTAFRPSTISAMPARQGQPASRRLHTVGWVTTNPCHH